MSSGEPISNRHGCPPAKQGTLKVRRGRANYCGPIEKRKSSAGDGGEKEQTLLGGMQKNPAEVEALFPRRNADAVSRREGSEPRLKEEERPNSNRASQGLAGKAIDGHAHLFPRKKGK